MSPEVFISYRRDDASGEAGRLADAIRHRFGHDSVFIDTTDIRLGTEWPQALRNAVENAKVLMSVIGPGWILARDEYGRRRIDDPKDWVRREIELALEHGKTIMPLLVRRARIIPEHALPREIASLSSLQAFEIHAESWGHDLEFVLGQLESHLGFCRSRKTAERVGGAIALGVHLRSSKETRRDRRVLSALGELLTDGQSSLIRYRAAEVLRSLPALVPTYDDELRHLAGTDENSQVRRWRRRRCRPRPGNGRLTARRPESG